MAIEYEIIKHVSTIRRWGSHSLELNIVKWVNNPEKYDLRIWEDGAPRRGVTMSAHDMLILFNAIGEEMDLFISDEDDDDEDESVDEESEDEFETEGDDAYDDDKDEDAEDEDENDTYEEEIDLRNFFVYGDGICSEDYHYDQEEVKAVIQVLLKDRSIQDIEINATYCPDCNAYYISEHDYLMIKNMGRLLCQIMSEEEYMSYRNGTEYSNLQPQSILNMIGYTVNATDDYSDTYRQDILTFAMESGLVTKKKAVNTLSYLVKLNESRPQNKSAVAKWKRDLAFLNGYAPGIISRFRARILIIHGDN